MNKLRGALQVLGWILITTLIACVAGLAIIAAHIYYVQPRLLLIEERIMGLERFSSIERIQILDVTAYSATVRQTDSDPHINASMQKPRPGDVAVSRDLFKAGFVFGRKIWIACNSLTEPSQGYCGIFTVADVMNIRWEKRIDIYFTKERRAWDYGKQRRAVALLNF